MVAVQAVAAAAQAAILFPLPDRMGDFHLAVRYQSAAAGAAVGGDLYDVAATPFGVRMIIGDVRGKGLPAIRMASIVLGAFREAAQLCQCLSEAVDRLDAATARFGGPEDFVTAAVLQFELAEPRVTMIRCGHPLPVLISEGYALVLGAGAETESLPLGLRELAVNRTEEQLTFAFSMGDQLLLFTDGLTEARMPGGALFGVEGVLRVCSSADTGGGQMLLAQLVKAARHHAGGNLDDDVALLLVERAVDESGNAGATGSGR